MFNDEPADYSDPRALLEEKEQPSHDEAVALAMGRLIRWLLEGSSPRLLEVGFRAYVIGHKISPHLVSGSSLHVIAKKLGRGRSAAQKISDDFASQFGVRGPHDKSEEAKRKYREAWRRRNILPCPTTITPPSRANAPGRSLP